MYKRQHLRRSFFVLLALSALLCPAAFAKGIPVETLAGQPAHFGEFLSKDKWTVVMVWTTYCGVCKKEYPKIARFHANHADTDAVVLGVSLDGFGQREVVEAYRAQHAHNFPSVLTDSETFADPYELTTGSRFSGTPTYLIFDRDGRLQAFKNGILAVEEIESFIAE